MSSEEASKQPEGAAAVAATEDEEDKVSEGGVVAVVGPHDDDDVFCSFQGAVIQVDVKTPKDKKTIDTREKAEVKEVRET